MKREIRLNVLRNWRFVLEWATFVSIICMIVTFALTASVLPMPAPPADADGLIAKSGGGICGLLFLLSRFPRLYKYPVKINADNVEIQYHIAKIALCAGQLITVVVTCVLMMRVYNQNITTDSVDFRDMLIHSGIAGGVVYMVYFLTARHYR